MHLLLTRSLEFISDVASTSALLISSRSHFGSLSPRVMESVHASSSMIALISQSDSFQFTTTVALFGEAVTLDILENQVLSKIRFLKELELCCTGITGEDESSHLADILLQRFQHSLQKVSVEVYFSVMSFFVAADVSLPLKLLQFHRHESVRVCGASILTEGLLPTLQTRVDTNRWETRSNERKELNEDPCLKNSVVLSQPLHGLADTAPQTLNSIFDACFDALMVKEVTSVHAAVTLCKCMGVCFYLMMEMSLSKIHGKEFHEHLINAENCSSSTTEAVAFICRAKNFFEALNFVLAGNSQGLLKIGKENATSDLLEELRSRVIEEVAPHVFFRAGSTYLVRMALMFDVFTQQQQQHQSSSLLQELINETNALEDTNRLKFRSPTSSVMNSFPDFATKFISNLISFSIVSKRFHLASKILMKTDFLKRIRFHTRNNNNNNNNKNTSRSSRQGAVEIYERIIQVFLGSSEVIFGLISSDFINANGKGKNNSISNSASDFAKIVRRDVFPILFEDLMGITHNDSHNSSHEFDVDDEDSVLYVSKQALSLRDSILRLICNDLLNFHHHETKDDEEKVAIQEVFNTVFIEEYFVKKGSPDDDDMEDLKSIRHSFSFKDDFLEMVSEFCVLDREFYADTLAALFRGLYRFRKVEGEKDRESSVSSQNLINEKKHRMYVSHLREIMALEKYKNDEILKELLHEA